jgi:MOSC domain-containing protein YiiM
MESTLEIVGLQVGLPEIQGEAAAEDPMDREWTTGFYKQPVHSARMATALGIEGDGQADLVNHGGEDKAINAYPLEHYACWASELSLPVIHGGFGENFTTRGLTEEEVCIGDIFEADGLAVQITQPRQPCWKLARRWRIKQLPALVINSGRTGWYFRVLQPNKVSAGVLLKLKSRPHPEWTVHRANDVMHHQKSDRKLAEALSNCEALSLSWKTAMAQRRVIS